MNKDITSALMFLRDQLKQQAQEALKPAEEKLKVAKAEFHDAKVLHNQLMKRAQKVQSLISAEMQLEHDAAVESEDAWEYKTESTLKAELEADDCLAELIKKVN